MSMRSGTLERKVCDEIDDLMYQLSDLANIVAGDIDAEAADTDIVQEVDAVRETWAVLAKSLTKLRAKARRTESR